MVFSSLWFLFRFLPIMLVVYYCTPRRFRNAVLFGGSLVFYAWGEPVYIVLILFSTLVAYCAGLRLSYYQKRENKRGQICSLTISCVVSLLLLGFFKYADFFLRMAGYMAGVEMPQLNLPLPIGISFYTFQTMSYVIDVYRGEVPAQHNFWHMLLYISFFPQLIAGPIVKYRDIAAQITGRKETIRKFAAGIMRFCWGLGKKVLLANSFARVVDEIFKYGPYAVSRKALWLGAILYMMQIYYDFSGYSDMAIGLGKMFGFEFQENFNYPYTAGSVQEFWHRWHISLSSWFRDYVYIPLGGNRKGAACTYRNLLIVFFLTGMWHGAGIAFILWGLYHGLFLILERVWLGKKLEKLPGIVGWGYTVTAVFFGWILFRAENISLFFTYVRNMFVAHGGTILLSAYLDSKMIFLIVMGVLFAGVLQKIYEKVRVHSAGKIPANGMVTVPRMIACMVIFWLSVAALVNNSYNPFIYFRF